MLKNKQKLFYLILAIGIFFGQLAFAQESNLTPGNCTDFFNQFNLKTQVTVNGTPQPNGNIVKGLPIQCSASGLILTVIQYALALSGIVAVAFLMMGGYFYITSGGNEEQSEKGKKILTNSVIGLAVIILSTLIVRITASTLTGLGGSNGGGTNNTTQTTTSGGNNSPGTTTNPPANTPCTGTPFDCVTSAQIQAYNDGGQDNVLGPQTTVTISPSSLIATIVSNANTTQSLAQLKVVCPAGTTSPTLYVYDSNFLLIGSAPFITVGSGMQATISGLNPFPKGNDKLTIQSCNTFLKSYTVPNN